MDQELKSQYPLSSDSLSLLPRFRQNCRQKAFRALHFCGGICVCAGWLDILKIGKNSTDL